MRYLLKEPFVLRGWEGRPYAVSHTGRGLTEFLTKDVFDVLTLCNGRVDFDSFLIPDSFRQIAEKIKKNGAIEECTDGREILPQQEYRLYPAKYIKTAHWSVTGRCNYRCKHCYMSAPDAKFGELSHETCMSIIDQLYECGIMNVSLTGGEALVRSDFMELVRKIREYGIRITTIYSNGKLVTPALLDELDALGIKPEFNLSFDGVGWHDWLRGVPGAEKIAEDAFLLCAKRGFPTAAEMCLHQKNKHTLRDSINLMASWGVRHLKTNPVADVGAWEKNAENNSLTLDELFEIYLDYIPHFFEDGSPMDVMLGGFFMADKGADKYFLPSAKSDGRESSSRHFICGHARNVMYIAADGRVLPCMSLSGMEIQNQFPLITEIGLANCLLDSSYMRLIETRLSEYLEQNDECRDCEHKYICGGGCRASALGFARDNIMAPDRASCAFFKGGYAKRIAEAAKGRECVNYKL